ncbi:MAG: hypothetical protein ABW122_12755 [Ilumatobacteraceae bacterium]
MAPAIPAQFDDELPSMRRGAPAIGEHSVEILTELGYSRGYIADLVADGTVGPLTEGGPPGTDPPVAGG